MLIVGSGGGEHILTALAENASPVVGIEMNPIVIDMVERRFADVGGGLFHYPGVRVELAEGRSYIARTQERFDVISFTLIDTWAATAGGAFSLTENYLFTMRSFDEYLDHLSDRGMIAIKRWRDAEDYVLRMVLLGRAALEARGQTKPENCIFVAADDSFVNILIKKQPFTMNEMMRALGVVEKFGLKTLYAPYLGDGDERMRDMIRTTDLAGWLAGQEQDLSPPTDDKPFFFNTVRPAHLLDAFKQSWSSKIRNVGTLILLLVFAIVSVLVLALIGGPLLFMKKHRMLLGANLRAAFYFALIGLGFLTIEIALMQSFILYLGHPTLTLSVFLATLLVSGAAGSAASSALGRERPKRTAVIVAILIASVALAIRAASPQIFAATLGLPTVARGLITAAMVFPLGFLMGIPFPLGVRAVREDETVRGCSPSTPPRPCSAPSPPSRSRWPPVSPSPPPSPSPPISPPPSRSRRRSDSERDRPIAAERAENKKVTGLRRLRVTGDSEPKRSADSIFRVSTGQSATTTGVYRMSPTGGAVGDPEA
ncbi:MAG: hypothetical protein M5R36_28085 [Deltaproteobacteria bacterium]|nr:hypothetical protein [Deltaproteobacteria bacterium]